MTARRFLSKKLTSGIVPPCTANGSCPKASPPLIPGKPATETAFPKLAVSKPKAAHADLADAEDEHSEAYRQFAASFKADLNPAGFVENFFAERAALTAWRLQRAVWETGTDPTVEETKLQRAEDRAERSLMKALAYLDRLREKRERKSWGQSADTCSKSSPRRKNEAPSARAVAPAPSSGNPAGSKPMDSDDKSATDASAHWRDRLEKDPRISTDSPVVKGTAITVKHVVTLIVDGWSWSDIVRTHPQLTEDDIRACLWYAMEEENASLHLK
jgi:uncharacterized protein (DUF433 family)